MTESGVSGTGTKDGTLIQKCNHKIVCFLSDCRNFIPEIIHPSFSKVWKGGLWREWSLKFGSLFSPVERGEGSLERGGE